MGKLRKGHNWKARKQKEVAIDTSEESKISIELGEEDSTTYDDANALVLPSHKRATKLKGPIPPPVKRLSRKQRKRLEKILEQKDKKQKRASLLEALKTVQVTKEELSQLQSTTELHNQAFKRRLDTSSESVGKVNAVAGSNKKRRQNIVIEDVESDEELESSDVESDSSDEEDVELQTKHKENEESKAAPVDTQMPDNTDISNSKETKKGPVITKQTDKSGNVPAVQLKPVTHVPVVRDPDIQAERLKLPILAEEQVIMETISENPITILCGETGSGKTTQIPQFLYEAGYAREGNMIAVTEPRRVAAISMASRVGREMNLTSRDVSYQIRYEGNVTKDTKIKFLTDGVLLKEVQKDFLLSSYSVVVIDEAHERSMYTDILIGLLSRIVPLRHKKGNPLKMIIMSATLRVEDFTENTVLFKTPPPVIKVDSRQFPVTVHFNKRTPDDYLTEAFRKVCKIHRELPEGGILVFVTGQQEVHTLIAKLKRLFPWKSKVQKSEDINKTSEVKRSRKHSCSLPDVNLDTYSVIPEDEEAEMNDNETNRERLDIEDFDNIDDNLSSGDSDNELQTEESTALSHLPLYALPLYSLLSTKRQQKVFEPPPEGCRLCVIATNVAETSITIPGIRYVVDTGKTKTKFYDKVTGVSTFKITWTSKASCNQRGGRAGRTGPGHCYRLFSSAVFNDELEQFSPPEIVRRPVDDLVLQMKAMCIDKVVNFPFPTPPSEESMKAAEQLLVALGALALDKKDKKSSSRITSLGQTMAAFPVSPRYGKMLSLGQQESMLAYVVTVVASLSVQELIVEPHGGDDEKQTKQVLAQLRRNWAGVGESLLLGDVSVLLHAVGGCEYAGGTEEFCLQHFMRYKAMVEIRKLRKQLTDTVNTVLPNARLAVNPKLAPPGELQCKLLRQILLAGLGDRVAKKMPIETLGPDGKKLKHAYKCTTTDDYVYIHPGSILYKQQPQYVVYQSLEETTKLYMKGVTSIEEDWLPLFAPNYCVFSKPQEEPKPKYDTKTGQVMCYRSCTFGAHSWPIPAVELPFPHSVECIKWFAVFILDGSVCPTLSKYKASLLSLPVTMVKSWAKLQPRTESFLKTLAGSNVYNRETLYQVWKKNPTYLLSAYKDWLPQALHKQIESIWPPVDR